MITTSRIDSVGQQLLEHGIGVVSRDAAAKIAAELPLKPRRIEPKAVVAAIEKLATDGAIAILDIGGGHIAIE